MRVRDLGALSVVTGPDEQPVTGPKAAATLALLAVHANQRVPVDALMAAAWGDRVPPGAASTLKSHVWRLRQLLEPERTKGQAPAVLVSAEDGYRLVCGPATLDSLQFAEAAHEVRDLAAAGHAEATVRRADAALGLWRGTPYGTYADTAWAAPAVARLDELRRQVQERRIEALLALGATDQALADLPPLIAATPYSEPLRALQMTALHRTGRTDAALEAYQDLRRLTVVELGLEPGEHLQDLLQRILRQDPTLTPAASPAAPPPPPRPVELHLPVTLTPLVGRAQAVGELRTLLGTHRLVTVIGAAGAGKTRVAVEVARAASEHFPDGVWFVDLTAVSDPGLVAEAVVSTIGFAGSVGATPLQDLRRYLQPRRLLLLLDNCEHLLDGVADVVAATLGDPGIEAECRFLLTSREPVDVPGEVVWTLPPLALPADEQDETPAVELFLQRLAAVAPTLPVDEQVRAHAARIAVAVDGLPLPLELAAARAHSHSLADVAAQVAADPGRLSRVGRAARDHRGTVRSAIEWSHRLLSPDEQRAHRRLSVLPGTFTAHAAAAVLEHDIGDTDDLVARLVHRSMMTSEGAPARGRPTTFRQLATIRSHGAHALAESGETGAALDRRDAWTAELVADHPPLGVEAEAGWYRRLDDDDPTVRATLTRRLVERPCPEGGRLAYRLAYFWYYRDRLAEAVRWLQLGQDVGPDDPADAVLLRIWLAGVHTTRRRLDLARPLLSGLDAATRDTAAARRVEVGEGLVVLAMAAYVREEPALLHDLHRLLTPVVDAAADTNLALLADATGCCDLFLAGRTDAAVALATSVQLRAEAAGNLLASYVATAPLIGSALLEGRPEDGLPWIDHCIRNHLRFGAGGTLGMFVETRAGFAAQLGDHVTAARTYAASRTATRRAGLSWPNRQWTHPLLALTRSRLSPADYERAWREGEQLTPEQVLAHARSRSRTDPGLCCPKPARYCP